MKKTIPFVLCILSFIACKKEVPGCTNSTARNYNANANKNDGSCVYDVRGCTDPNSKNYNSAATINDGSCEYEGQVLFWTNSNGGYAIEVMAGGKQGVISKFYSAIDPECGSSGCVTFDLPSGTHSFYAAEVNGTKSWSGDIVVGKNNCTKKCLLQ